MSKRVLVAQFGHETNTFSRLKTGLDEFRAQYCVFGDAVSDAVAGTSLELAGAEAAARQHGWNLVHSVLAWATPSGPVRSEAFEHIAGRILRTARERGPFHGALLALHGAMVTEHEEDAEGELLQRLRQQLGPNVPIAVTLDLHANVTDRMAANASILTAYRTYPHIDQRDTALRAAAVLQRAMNGEVAPCTRVIRGPLLTGLDDGRSGTEPMRRLLRRAGGLEAGDPQVLLISLHPGFALADIPDSGVSVSVTTDADPGKAEAIAGEFYRQAWDTRHMDSNEYLSVAEAMGKLPGLLDELRPGAPVVIADFADNPGAGAYGDSTFLLRGLLDSGLPDVAFGALIDPQAAAALCALRPGAGISLDVGGKIDPAFGPPLALNGTLKAVSDGTYVASGPHWRGARQRLGPTAVLAVGGVEIVICSHRVQTTELETFSHVGIDPRQRRVLGVKSMHHFRAAFEPIAADVLVVDSGALASMDYRRLPYRRVRRPVYPLDDDATLTGAGIDTSPAAEKVSHDIPTAL